MADLYGKCGGLAGVQAQARQAAEDQSDLYGQVHRITVRALAGEPIDSERIRQVVDAVAAGVMEGAAATGRDLKAAAEAALGGMDEALAQTAEAVKLAGEEAAGRINDFAVGDLRRMLAEMQALEGMFLDTLKQSSSSVSGTARQVLRQTVDHARRSGTGVGRTVQDTAQVLRQRIDEAAGHMTEAGAQMGRHLAQVAGGILAGIAERLEQAGRNEPPK